MSGILHDLQTNWTIYAAIPFVAAAIGYITKLAAVEMLLRPQEFKGIRPFLGWQGIIPRYAPRMADTAVDLMLGRMLTPQEIVDMIDPAELSTRLREPMSRAVDEMTREIMLRYQPGVWESLPEFVRVLCIKRIQGQLPEIIERTVRELRGNVDSVIDLKALAVNALISDTALLVKLIRRIGKHELGFIVKCGLPFGFIMGLVQMVTWALTHNVWVMPAFGAVTGLATDWLALQMIFRPIKPKKYFGVFRWQGLFHRRREEVAHDYGELIANEILTPANLLEGILEGPSAENLIDLIHQETQKALDSQLGFARPVAVLAIGGREYQEMKKDIALGVIKQVKKMSGEIEEFAIDAIDLRSLMTEKMSKLTDEEYEGLFRPAFKQDEWKIILVGAVLGFLVGELQVHLLLS